MPISNPLRSIAPLLGCCLTTAVSADVAKFSGNSHQLSGQLRSVDANGIIEWASPLSPEPLKLKSEKLDLIEFAEVQSNADPAPILLTLRNGDILPVTRIDQVETREVKLTNPLTGTATAPRAGMKYVQFGSRQDKIVYEGPKNLREWLEDGGEADNWDFGNDSLVSSGNSLAAHRFDLPQDFVLRFSLAWGKGSANFMVTFADPLTEGNKPSDRYRLQYSDAGMRIERQQAATGKTHVLAQWQRRASLQRNNKLDIEIHVRRSENRLEVLTNGKTEGIVADPFGNIPQGGGVTLANLAGSSLVFSGIQIAHDQSLKLARHLSEDHGDGNSDSLITMEDDRWSGQLLSINADAAPVLRFQTTVDKDPWEIPQNEVSTIFFTELKDQQAPGPSATFQVDFQQEGHLCLSNLRIDQQILSADHPWLGAVRIPLNQVRTIKRIQAP